LYNKISNQVATNVQAEIIKKFQNMGMSYIKLTSDLSGYNSDNENNFYKANKKITLNYLDNMSQKKEATLMLTLILQEHATGGKLFYGGYARIIDIKDFTIINN